MKIYEITSIKKESTQLDEALPALLLPGIIAGVRIAGGWAAKQGARILAQRGAAAAGAKELGKQAAKQTAKGAGAVAKGVAKAPIKHPVATATVGGGAYVAKKAGDAIDAVGDSVDDIVAKAGDGIDAIKDQITAAFGSAGFGKVAAFASKYAIPALAAVAILYGGKKIWDYLTKEGEAQPATESATAGATASGNVASVANPVAANAKIKRDKKGVPVAPQKKNKDGTAVNALDMDNNIMGGKPIKRVQ